MCRLLLLLLVVFTTPAGTSSGSKGLVVIVNPHSNVRDLSYEDLYTLYTLRQKTWDNGVPIRVYHVRRADYNYSEFIEDYLLIGQKTYERRVNTQIDSGAGTIHYVEDLREMIEAVSKESGAIGYARLPYETDTCTDLCIVRVR